jgi:hypothetical protein
VSIAAMTSIQQPSQPMVVPVEREPQHHPVFSNAVLAVLEVRFPPGYVSLFHTHSNDNVSVRLETGPTRTDTLDSAGVEQTAPVGRVVFNSASPPYTHRVANAARRPFGFSTSKCSRRRRRHGPPYRTTSWATRSPSRTIASESVA